jgi:hypothetical protein
MNITDVWNVISNISWCVETVMELNIKIIFEFMQWDVATVIGLAAKRSHK